MEGENIDDAQKKLQAYWKKGGVPELQEADIIKVVDEDDNIVKCRDEKSERPVNELDEILECEDCKIELCRKHER
jgi:hypothetical protein